MQFTLEIPAGFPPGKIIGKGGSTIKEMSARSGARLSVEDNQVVISGTASAVAEGEAMLQALFESKPGSKQADGG